MPRSTLDEWREFHARLADLGRAILGALPPWARNAVLRLAGLEETDV